MATTGNSFALDIDDALRTMPTLLPAATAALSRIDDSVLENLSGKIEEDLISQI